MCLASRNFFYLVSPSMVQRTIVDVNEVCLFSHVFRILLLRITVILLARQSNEQTLPRIIGKYEFLLEVILNTIYSHPTFFLPSTPKYSVSPPHIPLSFNLRYFPASLTLAFVFPNATSQSPLSILKFPNTTSTPFSTAFSNAPFSRSIAACPAA